MFDYTNQANNEAIASDLERYLDICDKVIIYTNKTKDEIKEAKKIIKKAIKALRNGNYEKVYDLDKCDNFDDFDEDEY